MLTCIGDIGMLRWLYLAVVLEMEQQVSQVTKTHSVLFNNTMLFSSFYLHQPAAARAVEMQTFQKYTVAHIIYSYV